MHENDWKYLVFFTLLCFLLLSLLKDFRFWILIILPFFYSVWFSRAEMHVGKVVLLSLTPIGLGLVLLFVGSILGVTFSFPLVSKSVFFAQSAIGFLVLVGLAIVAGIPLSYAGKEIQRRFFPTM